MVPVSEVLLPIGRFARLCRLSVKQLRHYDDLGLLAPAWTDPASGYRCYRPAQARDALMIGLLRAMDVPLPVVARVLSGDERAELKAARDRIEADVARRQRGLRLLDRVLAEGLPEHEVSLVREPARRVFTAREPATPATIPDATGACVARLLPRMCVESRPERAVVTRRDGRSRGAEITLRRSVSRAARFGGKFAHRLC